jgi:hypothetical protein
MHDKLPASCSLPTPAGKPHGPAVVRTAATWTASFRPHLCSTTPHRHVCCHFLCPPQPLRLPTLQQAPGAQQHKGWHGLRATQDPLPNRWQARRQKRGPHHRGPISPLPPECVSKPTGCSCKPSHTVVPGPTHQEAHRCTCRRRKRGHEDSPLQHPKQLLAQLRLAPPLSLSLQSDSQCTALVPVTVSCTASNTHKQAPRRNRYWRDRTRRQA